jgi:heterodisulfide reductase subunit A2
MEVSRELKFDTLVVGGGIAGLQAALDLADQNFKVAIVEKDATIGGKMIRLSKVFPTLDCASCITTPKMASAAHHENISIFTYCELESLQRTGGGIEASVVQKPRYVISDDCIGCRQCEYVCPIYVPNEEQGNFNLRKAVSIPFSNAIPQIAVLEMDNCTLCGKCAKACPTDAIDFLQQPEKISIKSTTAILTTGFKLTALDQKTEYGQGKVGNVITSLEMERLLAPHGPYHRVLRPSDGKEPESIAYVQCAGSRDKTLGVPYCSRICCMYAIKQAMLLSGSLPLADITIYYMDIRAFGKGYEQFYQNAKAMGIEFVKSKIAKIEQADNAYVQLTYENQEGDGGVSKREHDLVVLSLGMVPDWNPEGICNVSRDTDAFIKSTIPQIAPVVTDVEGVFAAGAALGPKDIVDSITEAGAAAIEAAKYLTKRKVA